MNTVNFYEMTFRITRQPKSERGACSHCWFRGSDEPCPNTDGKPVDHELDDELYCVEQDDDMEETFFVLDTPEGQADYIAKKLEGT
jgi:hypothetical protein